MLLESLKLENKKQPLFFGVEHADGIHHRLVSLEVFSIYSHLRKHLFKPVPKSAQPEGIEIFESLILRLVAYQLRNKIFYLNQLVLLGQCVGLIFECSHVG